MRQLEMLLRGVEEHADPERGLTNTVVERFCRLVCSSAFAGVFSADCIPERRLCTAPAFCMVVNLGERRRKDGRPRRAPLPLGHFVAISAAPDRREVRYFDPYGLPPTQPHVRRFLLRRRGEDGRVRSQLRQVQHFDSKCCGLFASLFAAYYDPGRASPPDFPLRFHRVRLRRNDALCARYLRRLIRR